MRRNKMMRPSEEYVSSSFADEAQSFSDDSSTSSIEESTFEAEEVELQQVHSHSSFIGHYLREAAGMPTDEPTALSSISDMYIDGHVEINPLFSTITDDAKHEADYLPTTLSGTAINFHNDIPESGNNHHHNHNNRNSNYDRRQILLAEAQKHIDFIRDWIAEVYLISENLAVSAKTNTTPSAAITNIILHGSDGRFKQRNNNNNNNNNTPSTPQSTSNNRSKHNLPHDIGITTEFEDAIHQLSTILSTIIYSSNDDKNNPYNNNDNDDVAALEDLDTIVTLVASVPNLMKTILLIDDDNDRRRMLSSHLIIRWVTNCRYSIAARDDLDEYFHRDDDDDHHHRLGVHSWFEEFIKSRRGVLRKRFLGYLEMVAGLSHSSLLPSSRESGVGVLKSHKRHLLHAYIDDERRLLHASLRSITRLMPSMLLLSDNSMERAASTSLMQHLVQYNLSRPFGISLLFFDLISRVAMVLCVRPIVLRSIALSYGGEMEVPRNVYEILKNCFAVICVVYAVFRKSVEGVSLYRIGKRVFLADFFRFWNVVDLFAMGLSGFVIACFFVDVSEVGDVTLETETWFLVGSAAIGVLWLNVLGFLKIMNYRFSLFILAVSQILRDIGLFTLVMLVVVIAFGDMMYILVSVNEDTCPENFQTASSSAITDDDDYYDDGGSNDAENISVFCGNLGDSYFAIYRVFIGDFGLDDFDTNNATIILYVLLTFFGIIILLNVLIALVCESYACSQSRAERLFARARLGYAASLMAFEDLVYPGLSLDTTGGVVSNFKNYFRALVKTISAVISLFVLGCIVLTIIALSVRLKRTHTHDFLLTMAVIFISLPLLMIWSVNSSYLITGWERQDVKYPRLQKYQNNYLYATCIARPITYLMRSLLGTTGFFNDEEITTLSSDDDDTENDGSDGSSSSNNDVTRKDLERYKDVMNETLKDAKDTIETHVTESMSSLERKMDDSFASMRERLESHELQMTKFNKRFDKLAGEILSRLADSDLGRTARNSM